MLSIWQGLRRRVMLLMKQWYQKKAEKYVLRRVEKLVEACETLDLKHLIELYRDC